MTLQEFLSSGNTIAIKKYKLTGILPSYVARPKTKKYSKGAAGMTALDRKLLKEKKERLKKKKSKGAVKRGGTTSPTRRKLGKPYKYMTPTERERLKKGIKISMRKVGKKKPKTYTY